MEQGWWGNYATGKLFLIDEHERWIRRGINALDLGVPSAMRNTIPSYKEVDDRDKLIFDLMRNASVMRVRGHGAYATFEFSSESWLEPLQLILKWGQHNAGSHLGLKIVNFAKKESVFVLYKDFEIKFKDKHFSIALLNPQAMLELTEEIINS